MNSVLLKRDEYGYLRRIFDNNNEYFHTLIAYLLEGDHWSNLIDPSISSTNDRYVCGNYYCTKREGYHLLLTDFHTLSTIDYDDLHPVTIEGNTLYGLAMILRFMQENKIPEFKISQENRNYIFTWQDHKAQDKKIIVNSDLGNLYNDTITQIIMRKSQSGWIWKIVNCNTIHDEFFVKDLPTKQNLDLFCSLITQHSTSLFTQLLTQDTDFTKTKNIFCDNIVISHLHNQFKIEPAKKENQQVFFETSNRLVSISITITKDSLIKFLEAWESHLQSCDIFTLVFLGHTLRFFEGEPLPLASNNKNEQLDRKTTA